jgi:hypothetical protein
MRPRGIQPGRDLRNRQQPARPPLAIARPHGPGEQHRLEADQRDEQLPCDVQRESVTRWGSATTSARVVTDGMGIPSVWDVCLDGLGARVIDRVSLIIP